MISYFVLLSLFLEVTVFADDPVFTNLDDVVTIPDTAAIGDKVKTVSATDAGTASSSLVYYMTSSSLYFEFDTVTKKISVMDILESGTYSLDFLVIDTSDASATGTLTVIVNNSITSITSLPASASVREDTINETLLHTLETTDQSPNDTVTCSQTSGNDDFPVKQINGTTKYGLYLRAFPTSLDYSVATSHPLTIECTDSKTSVSGNFTVTVTENSQPTFQNLPHSITLGSSSTDVGTVVFTLSSADADDTQLFCNMTSDPDPCPFLIHDSGDVITTEALSGSNYVLDVYLYDGYSLVGPSALNISITAEANNAPVMTNLPQTIQLSENAALGASVYQVNVSDADSGQNRSFSAVYTPSSAASLFDIDVATGLISTSPTDNVDYESLTMTSVEIEITVHDGTNNATSNLTIDIQDVSEQPSFQHSVYYLSGDEGSTGTSFGNPGFIVDDEDVSDSHSYQLNCSQFQMNSTDITLAAEYDLDQTGSASSVTCLAMASDSVYTTTTTLSVTVNYKNDHTPSFQSSNYTFTVDSSSTIGYSLGSVSAADSDVGDDGTVFYSLNQSSLSNEYFDVDNSGIVFIKNSLDEFAANGSTVVCTAVVTDTGGLSATASVTIVIDASSTINTTTTTTTTTTERYLTFIEDPKNVIWLTCFCGMGAVTSIMALVVGYRKGVFQNLFQKAKDGCSRNDDGFDDNDDEDDENEVIDDTLEEYSNEDDDDDGDGNDSGVGDDTGSSSPRSRNDTVTTIGNTVDTGWNPWNNSTDL